LKLPCAYVLRKLPSQDCCVHFYMKIHVKTSLSSSLIQDTIFNVSSSKRLQDFRSPGSPRQDCFCCFCDPRLTLLFPARFSCIRRTPAHSDGYPSLDTARSQYSICSCTDSFCLVCFGTVFRYVTDQMLYTGFFVMFCFSLSGIWSFTAV